MSDEELRSAHELESDEPGATVPQRDEHPGSERRRRPVADWGGDDLFNHVPRRRFARTGVGPHTRRPSASPITSHQLRRNADFAPGALVRGAEAHGAGEPDGITLSDSHTTVAPSLISVYEPEGRIGHPVPGPVAVPPAARERRRARMSVDERVGPRPDRIAALAFVLGLLLVLLAVATADAAILPAL